MAGILELVKEVKSDIKLTEAQVTEVVKATFESIKTMCENGEKVMVKGFGTFQLKTTPAHEARNPMTGKPVSVPEKSKVVFKASVPS